MEKPERRATGLLWPGLALLAAAAGFECLWLARAPTTDGGMAFAARRLGLRLVLSPVAYEAFAVASAVAALGFVVASFAMARRAMRRAGRVRSEGGGGRLAVAFVVLVAGSLPLHHLVGWAAGGLRPVWAVGAAWERASFFKHLGSATVGFLWLAPVVSLGAHLLLTPWRWPSGAIARGLARLSELPRALLVAVAAATVGLLALGVSLRSLGGHPWYPDAATYFHQAKTFVAGRVSSPLYGGREFFDPEWELTTRASGYVFQEGSGGREGRWFSVGQPGAPLLFAAGIGLGCPWIVVPLLGAGVVVFTYLLAREAFGEAVALIALPLAALSPWLVLMSADYMTHVPCAFALVVFMWAGFRAMERASSLAAAVAGLALGVGATMRAVTALAICLPMMIAWVAWLVRRPRDAWMPSVAFGLALVPPLAGLLAYNVATTGTATTFAYQVVWNTPETIGGQDYRVPGWSWGLLNGVSNVSEMCFWLNSAVFRWPLPALGCVIAVLVLAGVGDEKKGRRRALILAASALALVVAYARFEDVPAWLGGPRYVFEILPIVVVFTAVAAHALWKKLRVAGSDDKRAVALLAVLVALLGAHAIATLKSSSLPTLLERAASTLRLLETIESRARAPALVFVPVGNDLRLVSRFRCVVARNDPALRGPIFYARDAGAHNHKLIADLPDRRNCYRWDDRSSRLVRLAPDGVSEAPEAATGRRTEDSGQ